MHDQLSNTRAIIDAILKGELDDAETHSLPIFNFHMPTNIKAFPSEILEPRASYDDASHWHERAHNLTELFVKNFEKFTDTQAGKDLLKSGPQLPN